MRDLLISRALFVIGGLAAAVATAAAAERPNIIFIMADDLGINDLGVYGQNARRDAGLPYISTPNLDAMAQGGLRFNEWYAPATVCAPTRVSVLTGLHTGHSAVDSNGLNNNGGNAMRADEYSFAQGLQSVGYTTGAFGKWGSGMDGTQLTPVATNDNALINHPNPQVTHPNSTPTAKGFDEFYGYLNHIHAHNYYIEYLWEHDTDNSGDVGGVQVDQSPTTSDYSHDLIAAKSIDFIRDHAGGSEPFFMYGEYTIPHNDFNPPNDAFLQMYTDPVAQGGQGLSGNQADYGAMITRLDHNVGQILDALRDPNNDGDQSDSVIEDTLVIFGTDNGPTGNSPAWYDSNGIYRGTKNDVYEGAHRSPFIVYWEGQYVPIDAVNGDVNANHYGTHTDLFATFGELAGYEVPVGLDSRSMAGLLTGDEVDEHDYLVWEDRPSGDWAIRWENYKLLKTGNNVLQLYNLSTDPSETTNLLNGPTAQQQAIANLLQQVALDEGVESDVGNGGAQNTHIVQYKSWNPTARDKTDFNNQANWAGGSEFNTRGTPANNFGTGPANNWIASIDNTGVDPVEIAVNTSAEVLGLEVTGSNAPTTVRVGNGLTLMARNGMHVNAGARVELDGGTLETVRKIEIRAGGELAGRGDVGTGYDTSGTPFTLNASVENAGRLEIGGDQVFVAEGATLELLANGGFESGTGNPFSGTDDWFNFTGNQALNVRNGTNPASGAFRGIVGLNSNGVDEPAPAQDTGHVISLDEEYTLEFSFAGASAWDEGVDQFTATLYYLDGATPIDLDSLTVTPNLAFGSGYETITTTFAPIANAGAVGKNLLVRFQTLGDAAEFASIDDVSLSILGSPVNVLAVEGDVTQTADGVMAFELFGDGGDAGIDFDRLEMTGQAALAGTLEVALAGGFRPEAGDAFEILAAADLGGTTFDTHQLPDLYGGLYLEVQYHATGVTLAVAGIPGDYNLDGAVDAADYTVWRESYGAAGDFLSADGDGDGVVTQSDYTIWRQNYGMTAAAASSQATTPEPGGAALLALSAVLAALSKRASRIARI